MFYVQKYIICMTFDGGMRASRPTVCIAYSSEELIIVYLRIKMMGKTEYDCTAGIFRERFGSRPLMIRPLYKKQNIIHFMHSGIRPVRRTIRESFPYRIQ